ncbi:MAG: response regulator [Elusimicrobiota bacterium]|jgi:signal transduction histidine kinase
MNDNPKGKILVVEDEPVLAQFICRAVAAFGYGVVGPAATGEAAVESALSQAPDIILMDISLRGEMDGIEAMRRIRNSRDVPVVFLSAHADPDSMERAKAISPSGYLLKPFDARELGVALEIALIRHYMESELRRSNLRFRALLEASPDTILRMRGDGALLESSVKAGHISELLPDNVAARVLACVAQCLDTGLRQRMEYSLSGAGDAKWYEWISIRLDAEEVVAIIRDVTEHKTALLRANESMSMFQHYAQSLQAAREDERQAMAREIHDELGQTLVGLKMQLAACSCDPDRQGAALQKRLGSMTEAIDRAISEVRGITTQLRPLILDDLGLGAALEWLQKDFEHRTGIRCTLARDEVSVDPGRATAMFRIVQEALTNVARHARASRVTITLKQDGAQLVVTVRDNGRGLVGPEAEGAARGQGLLGMRERAVAWGGSVTVTGSAGKGTVVSARVPLAAKGGQG